MRQNGDRLPASDKATQMREEIFNFSVPQSVYAQGLGAVNRYMADTATKRANDIFGDSLKKSPRLKGMLEQYIKDQLNVTPYLNLPPKDGPQRDIAGRRSGR